MNSLFVIQPYKAAGTWVFDDPRVDLLAEPFVSGIPEMINQLVAEIPNAESGFRLLFAAKAFPGTQVQLDRLYEEADGWWYYTAQFEAKGWLCPALFKYFDTAPAQIWVRAEKLQVSA